MGKMKDFVINNWKKIKKIKKIGLFLVAVTGGLVGIYNYKIAEKSMQNDLEYYSWEQQQEEDSHKPRLQMERKQEMPLGTEYYRKYVLHNEGETLSSGEMYLTAQLVLKYKGYFIKNIAIDGCFYEQTVHCQVDANIMYILLWKPDVLRGVEQIIRKEIEAKTGGMILAQDIDIELCALAYFEYITAQNKREKELFLIKFGDYSSCERYINDAYLYHDKYHISVDRITLMTKEKGFQELIDDIVKRLMRLDK